LIVALLAVVITLPSGGHATDLDVTPKEVIPGGIARVTLQGACEGAQGSFGGKPLQFFRTSAQGPLVSLIGVDLGTSLGTHEVSVRCDGWTGRVGVLVRDHEFPKQELTVDSRYVRPNPAEQARAATEAKRLKRLWGTTSAERLWRGRFQRPAAGSLGSAFGLRRVFNGEPRSPHSGIDIRAKRGTPVVAANTGRVVLRDELFFAGNTVALDHGLGLYTVYLHLSEFKVSEGEMVAKGRVIGLVGATGRVTGPHLHFSARLGGARVDPWQLITQDLERGVDPAGDGGDDLTRVVAPGGKCSREQTETRKGNGNGN
jgi:hypothetical protein